MSTPGSSSLLFPGSSASQVPPQVWSQVRGDLLRQIGEAPFVRSLLDRLQPIRRDFANLEWPAMVALGAFGAVEAGVTYPLLRGWGEPSSHPLSLPNFELRRGVSVEVRQFSLLGASEEHEWAMLPRLATSFTLGGTSQRAQRLQIDSGFSTRQAAGSFGLESLSLGASYRPPGLPLTLMASGALYPGSHAREASFGAEYQQGGWTFRGVFQHHQGGNGSGEYHTAPGNALSALVSWRVPNSLGLSLELNLNPPYDIRSERPPAINLMFSIDASVLLRGSSR